MEQTQDKDHIGRDWLAQAEEEKQPQQKIDTRNIAYGAIAALNVIQIEDSENGEEMGGFKYTKKKGDAYQCRLCGLFAISIRDCTRCINAECESNIIKPRVPGKKVSESVKRVGNVFKAQLSKSKGNKKKVRGKEFEKGKIPDFTTVNLANLHHTIFQAQ